MPRPYVEACSAAPRTCSITILDRYCQKVASAFQPSVRGRFFRPPAGVSRKADADSYCTQMPGILNHSDSTWSLFDSAPPHTHTPWGVIMPLSQGLVMHCSSNSPRSSPETDQTSGGNTATESRKRNALVPAISMPCGMGDVSQLRAVNAEGCAAKDAYFDSCRRTPLTPNPKTCMYSAPASPTLKASRST